MRENLGNAVASVARANLDRPALWAKGELLTYDQLLKRATAISHALIEGGVSPGDRVAILSQRTADAYVSILGVLFACAAYVPLNLRFPRERNGDILARSGATALICGEPERDLAAELIKGARGTKLLIQKQAEAIEEVLPCETIEASLAYVFFTSGTTGVPKGVPITHENVFAYLRGIRTITDVTAQDRVLQIVDLTFDLSVHDIFLAWTSGACLYSVPENGTLLATRFVEEHRCTHWLSVPSAASLVKQVGLLTPRSLPSLRYSFFCGEALAGAVAESWGQAAPNSEIINIYGPTEATVAFSYYKYIKGQKDPPAIVPLGQPFPEQRMGLFNENGVKTTGDTGEICLSGSQVSAGYWNAPEITAERFFKQEDAWWYRTGDLGRYDPTDGYIYLGRADRQVKLRGYRVELQEIEGVVLRITHADIAAVVPWPLDTTGAALGCVAFIVGGESDEGTLDKVKQVLPDYMVPSRIEKVRQLPLNANGKVDHAALSASLSNSAN